MILIEQLTAAGFNIQLQHDDKETSFSSHGYVVILKDGEELARHDSVQHNRNYHERANIFQELTEAIIDRHGAGAGSAVDSSIRQSSL